MFEFEQIKLSEDRTELTAVCRLSPHRLEFQGHFPHQPMLPAASQLAMLQALLGDDWGRICGGKALKFLLPLLPDDEIELQTRRPVAGEIHFQLVKNGHIATKGILFAMEE